MSPVSSALAKAVATFLGVEVSGPQPLVTAAATVQTTNIIHDERVIDRIEPIPKPITFSFAMYSPENDQHYS